MVVWSLGIFWYVDFSNLEHKLQRLSSLWILNSHCFYVVFFYIKWDCTLFIGISYLSFVTMVFKEGSYQLFEVYELIVV